MATRKSAGPAARTGKRRKPEGREERVLHHVGLEAEVADDLDTMVWFQAQQYFRSLRNRAAKPPKPLKEELLDAAVRTYLDLPRSKRPSLRVASRNDVRITFWVSGSLTEQIDAIAAEKGVSPARVLDSALAQFVAARVTDAARGLRRDTEDRATRFLERMFGG